MKRRQIDPQISRESAEDALCRALLALRGVAQMRSFLRDLCTPAELEALTDRWRVVPYLSHGLAYREIHERTGVSVTTIGRVARCLAQGNGGYRAAVGRAAAPVPRRASARTPKPRAAGTASPKS